VIFTQPWTVFVPPQPKYTDCWQSDIYDSSPSRTASGATPLSQGRPFLATKACVKAVPGELLRVPATLDMVQRVPGSKTHVFPSVRRRSQLRAHQGQPAIPKFIASRKGRYRNDRGARSPLPPRSRGDGSAVKECFLLPRPRPPPQVLRLQGQVAHYAGNGGTVATGTGSAIGAGSVGTWSPPAGRAGSSSALQIVTVGRLDAYTARPDLFAQHAGTRPGSPVAQYAPPSRVTCVRGTWDALSGVRYPHMVPCVRSGQNTPYSKTLHACSVVGGGNRTVGNGYIPRRGLA
jgi:hypothetical protein